MESEPSHYHPRLSGNRDEDTKSIHPDFSYPSDTEAKAYIDAFVKGTWSRIGIEDPGKEAVQRLSSALPDLLQDFVSLSASHASSQVHLNLTTFLYTHREEILASFESYSGGAEERGTEYEESRDFSVGTDRETSRHEGPSQTKSFAFPKLEDFVRIIFAGPSSAWFLSRVRREMVLETGGTALRGSIRQELRAIAPIDLPTHVGQSATPGKSTVVYVVHWDVLKFLKAQEYDVPSDEAIANAITLTGPIKAPQALTCRQYIDEVWPLTGRQTLVALQGMLRDRNHRGAFSFQAPFTLDFKAHIDGTSIFVTATGPPVLLMEIGEQLGWLGATLIPIPPNIHIAIVLEADIRRASTPNNGIPATVFSITCCPREKYPFAEFREYLGPRGTCWHYLFVNCIIAKNLPTPRRDGAERGVGLEMPLEMMIALSGTRYIDTFKGKVFIKGFSAMLVPVKQSGNLLIWHLLHSENPSKRISYLDCVIEHTDVKVADLGRLRHVLGWCSNAISIAGTMQATYSVEKSRLPNVHSTCLLEKVEVSGGQFVTGTAAFTLGNAQKPVHITRFGYLSKLQWISSKYFVFWDEEEKRGWLVNGASALLHILRASLEHSRRKFHSAWLLDPESLSEVIDSARPRSALEVLADENNRNLKLYIDKTEVYDEETWDGQMSRTVTRRQTRHYRLEDRIEHIYNILEKLIDCQTDAERQAGLKMNIRPRRQLEGWDFKDLVADGDPFFARVATLQTIGKGWVDFTRAIHAVTLFGRGFGELIQPRTATAMSCPLWSQLPSGKYYLAAYVPDLQYIMENDGDPTSNPRRLCHNIVWHMNQATFCACPCTSGSRRKHHDPVQVFFTLKSAKRFGKRDQVELQSRGAVIFGHNLNIHWHWGDYGDPVRGDPPQDLASRSEAHSDSGLGSSLDPSSHRPSSEPERTRSAISNRTSPRASASPPRGPPEAPPKKSKGLFRRIVSSISKRRRTQHDDNI